MKTTEKTAGIFGPSAEQVSAHESALNKFYGDKMLSSLGAGAGVGLGAAALYHLLRSLKPEGKKEKKYVGYGSGSPVVAKMATFAPQKMDMSPFAMTTVGKNQPSPFHNLNPNVQPGGIYGLMHSLKMPGMQNGGATNAPKMPWTQHGGPTNAPNFSGSGQGGIAGSSDPTSMKIALDGGAIAETLGRMLPKTMIPFSLPSQPGKNAPTSDPYAWRKAWGTAANLGAGALGLYGGKKVVDLAVKAKKKKDMETALEAARQDYYSALAGDKSASALDFAFETVKSANILGSLGSAAFNTPQTLRTAYLLAMLGAGGVGAKYMYDKTKAVTEGENLAKAQASRARTKGLPPIWVDPESLANVKALAGSHE